MTEAEKKTPNVVRQVVNALLVGLITFLIMQVWRNYNSDQTKHSLPLSWKERQFSSSTHESSLPEIAELQSFQAIGSIGFSLELMTSYDTKIPLAEGVFLSTGLGGEFVLLMKNDLQLTLKESSTIQIFKNGFHLYEGSFVLNNESKKYPKQFFVKVKNENIDLKILPAEYIIK